jgi:hypothetical protein
MVLKVAVVGLSPKTHDLAPWDDPTWQKWGLPWDEGYWARMDRWFEMHDRRLLESEHCGRRPGYLERIANLPVYTQENYPFDEVAKSIGAYYFNSSIAYAMALAIHEGAEEIGVWGVDLTADEEYAYQKPNMEYLIGVARGKGIQVFIPEDSALCKFNGAGIKFYKHSPVYVDRYGWLGE